MPRRGRGARLLARISHYLKTEARDSPAINSLRLLGTIARCRVAARDRQDCRSLRRAPLTDGPLTHFVSPPGEKCKLVDRSSQSAETEFRGDPSVR